MERYYSHLLYCALSKKSMLHAPSEFSPIPNNNNLTTSLLLRHLEHLPMQWHGMITCQVAS